MAIKYNGQDLVKRYINGREVEKVMKNGVEIWSNTVPPTPFDDYLCFTKIYRDWPDRIQLRKYGAPTTVQIEISYDKENWEDYNWDSNGVGDMIELVNVGDKVYRRNKSGTPTAFSIDDSNYYGFSVYGMGLEVSGDVNSLLCKNGTTELSPYCYYQLFSTNGIITAPKLSATTLARRCYYYMFSGCTSLTTAPELPATTLASFCYCYMFNRCTSLTTAPELPATTLTNVCYGGMFSGCTSLTTAPELPATTLAEFCYQSMFSGCTSLITAPELPATTLAECCYQSMFHECTSLTTAPELPATTLARYCYQGMFYGCTSLTTTLSLPATTLTVRCYKGMFYGCTSLTTVPELPATRLVYDCYCDMFSGCSSIRISTTQTGDYQTPYTIPTNGGGTEGTDSLSNMFADTGGPFTGTPEINRTYYTSNTVV